MTFSKDTFEEDPGVKPEFGSSNTWTGILRVCVCVCVRACVRACVCIYIYIYYVSKYHVP